MCALYAGIYRVALRLQRAAEARRNRMASSLVSVASHAVTTIGLGLSVNRSAVPAPAAVPPPAAAAAAASTPTFADRNGANGRSTAVAELHSSNAGEDPLTSTSPGQSASVPLVQTSDDDGEHRTTGNNAEMPPEDCDHATPIESCQLDTAAEGDKPPAEETPLLERFSRRASNNYDGCVASTSGTERRRLPAKGMTSSCRRRWLIVLVGDEVEGCGARRNGGAAAVDGRRRWEITASRSFDAGRPGTCRGTSWPRRSLIELATSADATPGGTSATPSASSSCLDGSRRNDSSERVSASVDEDNVVNDVTDVATAAGRRADGTPTHSEHGSSPQHPPNESATGFGHLSAVENQLAIEVDHVATATMTSFVKKREQRAAESVGDGEVVWMARREQSRLRKNNEDSTKKNDAGFAAEKPARRMADRWRRAATSPFAANRRFAHLRHWKLKRHLAAQSPTTSSSIDARQIMVSRLPLPSSVTRCT